MLRIISDIIQFVLSKKSIKPPKSPMLRNSLMNGKKVTANKWDKKEARSQEVKNSELP